jgi:hypothetical protein
MLKKKLDKHKMSFARGSKANCQKSDIPSTRLITSIDRCTFCAI